MMPPTRVQRYHRRTPPQANLQNAAGIALYKKLCFLAVLAALLIGPLAVQAVSTFTVNHTTLPDQ